MERKVHADNGKGDPNARDRRGRILMREPETLGGAGAGAIHGAAARAALTREEVREILAVVRSGSGLHVNVHHLRGRLAQLARRIPDFEAFRSLCVRDLRDTWHEDQDLGARTVRNRVGVWKRLFNYFARATGIDAEVRILALDHGGGYACTLAPRRQPDHWERFIQAGLEAGVPLAELDAMRARHQAAPLRLARAAARQETD